MQISRDSIAATLLGRVPTFLSRNQLLQVCCPSSLQLAKPSQNTSLLRLVPGCGYNLIQKMPATINRVVKDKLLLSKVKDHAFEDLMKAENKYTKLQRVIQILRKRHLEKMPYRYMIRKGREVHLHKPEQMTDILKKYPRFIDIYQGAGHRELWVRLAKPVLELLDEEKKLKEELLPLAVLRLRKLLMMSSTRTIRLDRIGFLKDDLGLPDNFQDSVVEKYPEHFKLVGVGEKWSPQVELLSWDPDLAVPVIERKRQKHALINNSNHLEMKLMAFSFPISYPPGFKIEKHYRIKVRRWQKLPYRSPYEDASDLDLKSLGSFKRAVAVLHEYLHLTVEKKTKVERIAHLREDLKLPQRIGITVLQHPGIFYFSTKGTGQTIFLREAYHKGQLKKKNDMHKLKEKFMELIRMGTKNIKKEEKKEKESKEKMFVRATEKEAAVVTRDNKVIDQENSHEVEMLEEGNISFSEEESDECNEMLEEEDGESSNGERDHRKFWLEELDDSDRSSEGETDHYDSEMDMEDARF